MKLYHFTSVIHLPRILETGHLRRTETNLMMMMPHAGPDAVWLMDTPELGGFGHGLVTPNSMVDKTEVRFTVETDDKWTAKWLDWARAQGIDQAWLDILLSTAGGADAAEHWYISFAKVPRASWLEVANVKTGETLWES